MMHRWKDDWIKNEGVHGWNNGQMNKWKVDLIER